MKLLVAIVLCIFVAHTSKAQVGQCQPNATYACVMRNHFQECFQDNRGKSTASDTIHSCKLLNSKSTDPVCYGGSKDPNEICGPAPPACTQTGNFPVTGRCKNYYTCVSTGTKFVQYINECEEGYEFNVRNKACTTTATAGCSVPFTLSQTVTPASSETVETTTASPPNCTSLLSIPDPTSCRHYYQCFLGPRRVQCPFRFVYDIARRNCVISTDCGLRPNV